jgi:hypothetical protein
MKGRLLSFQLVIARLYCRWLMNTNIFAAIEGGLWRGYHIYFYPTRRLLALCPPCLPGDGLQVSLSPRLSYTKRDRSHANM